MGTKKDGLVVVNSCEELYKHLRGRIDAKVYLTQGFRVDCDRFFNQLIEYQDKIKEQQDKIKEQNEIINDFIERCKKNEI